MTHQDYWSLHMHLHQCQQLHNLHLLQKKKKIGIGGTGGRLGDRFAEHLRDIERNERDVSKPVDSHWNLPNHSKQHLEVCGLPIHQDSSESYILLEQKFIFQIGTMNPHSINERFSISQYILVFNSSFSRRRFPTLFSVYKHTHTTHNSSIRSDEGLTPETSALKLFTVSKSSQPIKTKIT